MASTRKRIDIPLAIKQAVFTRDGGVCQICRLGESDGVAIEYDHYPIPWMHGGTNAVDNLRLLCRRHNNETGQALRGRRTVRLTQLRRDVFDADVFMSVMSKES